MPYCPKCDMEFIDGIITCSDCGGELVNREVYEAEALARKKQQSEAAYGRGSEMGEPDDTVIRDESGEGLQEQKSQRRPAPGVYVSSRQRYEDLRSSSAAFLLVGGAAALFSALCWAGIIKLPMAELSRLFFQTVSTLIGVACLVVSVRTRSSTAAVLRQAEEEEQRTKEVIDRFLASRTGAQLDGELTKEDPELSGEELQLKRFELIQDYLVTGHDLPDQAYVDALAEELYQKLYD